MSESMPSENCAVCGSDNRQHDPLLPDAFYPGVAVHLSCLNSPSGREWRAARMAKDPGYRRYMDLITMGRQVSCASCGSTDNYLYQKSGGHSPSFELCCTQCAQISEGLSPYEHTVTGPLSDLQQRFVRGVDLETIGPAVERLSREHAARHEPEKCECGGTYVIAAKPRCLHCREVLMDTFFHYTDRAPRWPKPQPER